MQPAALAGNLPDIIDVDGPVISAWSWVGWIAPLPIDDAEFADFLLGTKGIWNGTMYSIGLWDAAVVLYARRSTLDKLGLRTPKFENRWSGDEFMAAPDAAKASGKYGYTLGLGTPWTGEWYPNAVSPFPQSFGGDMIDRDPYTTAKSALDGDAAVALGEWAAVPKFEQVGDVVFLPVGGISMNNYAAAFERAPIGLFVFNAVFVTGTTLLLSLFLCSMAAFSIAAMNWRGRSFVLGAVLAILTVGFPAVATPHAF